jgi:hypothetical protein
MNNGKSLEQIVKDIENILLPQGFSVSTREKIYEDGVQIAEFDILIKGVLGTSPITWLIECRDRPSEGHQPVSWIEQLIGRRTVHKFDKITAVSTTGFTKGAIHCAKKNSIDLHSIDQLSSEDIVDWWKASVMVFEQLNSVLVGIEIVLDSSDDKNILERVNSDLNNRNYDTKVLALTATGEKQSFLEAWTEAIKQKKELYDGIIPNNEVRHVRLHVNYTNPDSRYRLENETIRIDVIEIIYSADLSIKLETIPINKAVQISSPISQNSIASLVNFETKFAGNDVSFTFHKFPKSEDLFVSIESTKSINY